MEGTQEAISFKQWMFQENVRVENEKKELNEMYVKFLDEKKQFQEEMKALNARILAERRRLKEESLFFDKKMDILKGGFEQLEADRRQFEQERAEWEQDRQRRAVPAGGETTAVLFQGVKTPAALKKRYKDLIKIFHPDSAGGDTELIRQINGEYERLRELFDK